MYRFFKKFFSTTMILSCLQLIIVSATLADDSFSLRPVRPPAFKRLSRLLEKAQSSPLLNTVDTLMRLSGIYEIAAACSNPRIVILPPAVRADRASSDNTGSIRILSANLLLFPAPVVFDQEQRIAEFAKCVRSLNPDIILTQEVWDNRSLGLLIAALPDYYSIFSPGIGYNHSGLLTLSRFAPETCIMQRFPTSLQHSLEELMAQKSILQTTLKYDGQILHLFNTHLYSAAPHKRYRPNLRQFKLLADTIDHLSGRTIVGGDMNLLPADLKILMPKSLQFEGCNLPTAGYPSLKRKLDYILAGNRSGQTVISGRRIDPPRRFSDHNPVFAEIKFVDK
ncbi:MAG: hypothetical protein GX569_15125 [Candidatus Riflebacteria bacterium]|nr:hypothetical protein [Candidatus Riflebacteria bacterium]